MNKFKSKLMPMHAKNKSELHWLYDTVDPEEILIFSYENIRFKFGCASFRNPEKLMLFAEIPGSLFNMAHDAESRAAMESHLLAVLAPAVNEINNENINKSAREFARFSAQCANEIIIRRNGMLYCDSSGCFEMKIDFTVPLIKELYVNAKAALKAVRELLRRINKELTDLDLDKCGRFIETHKKQLKIRRYMKENSIAAFIADGSVLPREGGTSDPKKGAKKFMSPQSMRIGIPMSDGDCIYGMAIRQGVTVITGGGYSGKSTLLDAVEMGIYDHVPGDGREYVITDDTALKIYAEDGRPVLNLDMSAFFRYFPDGSDVRNFSTLHASGSVSQAANIIEAISGGSRLLLIDEDRSATNFMIRDQNMRKVVKKEPIIPFTDRVRELYTENDVSTILVIGGSSEYIGYADKIILMEDCAASDITDIKEKLCLPAQVCEAATALHTEKRYLEPRKTNQQFLYFRSVSTENARKIIMDEYCADITVLTALISEYQTNTLTYLAYRLLTDKQSDRADLIEIIRQLVDGMYEAETGDPLVSSGLKIQRWFEAVRPIDVFCCINRMRGLLFY